MPAPITLIRCDMIGELDGQEVMSTFTYQAFAINPDQPILNLFAAVFQGRIQETYLGCLSEDYSLFRYRVSFLTPTRALRTTIIREEGVGPGVRTEPRQPCFVSAVIDRAELLSVRRFHGRLFMPGVPTPAQVGGVLLPASLYYQKLQELEVLMKQSIDVGTGTSSEYRFLPCIVTLRPPLTQEGGYRSRMITATLIRSNVRTQRRRIPGHGR